MVSRQPFGTTLKNRFVLLAIAAALIVITVFSPSRGSDTSNDKRLSTFVAGAYGAMGLHDVARRLGWKTERRTVSGFDSLSAGSIIAVLDPMVGLSERETGLLVEKVRSGASLLVTAFQGGPLSDSLGLKSGRYGTSLISNTGKIECKIPETRSAFQLFNSQPAVIPFDDFSPRGSREMRVFLNARNTGVREDLRPLAIGYPFGSGRIVAISDENLLRNDFIRVCKWGVGVATIRMLEYLSNDRRRSETTIVFDEYHQGFGKQPSLTRTIRRALFHTPPGFAVTQLIAAAILLLIAVAPRPIAPRDELRFERRSPFEHVEALSTAYGQIGATRTATERLVAGLRRRLHGGMKAGKGGEETSAQFLERVSGAYPHVAVEAASLKSALSRQITDEEFVAAGEAILTIERTITK